MKKQQLNLFENLNSNFIMMYIIHKMLVVLKNNLNYLKNSALECFFKKNIIEISEYMIMESFSLEGKTQLKI